MSKKQKYVSMEPPGAFPDERYEVVMVAGKKAAHTGIKNSLDDSDDPARAAAVDAIVARIRERKKHA